MCVLIPALQMRAQGLEGQKIWPAASSMFLQGLGCNSGALTSSNVHGSSCSSSPRVKRKDGSLSGWHPISCPALSPNPNLLQLRI